MKRYTGHDIIDGVTGDPAYKDCADANEYYVKAADVADLVRAQNGVDWFVIHRATDWSMSIEGEVYEDVLGHWFIQGGQAQFGNLKDVTNADELISEILSVVRTHLRDEVERSVTQDDVQL